MRLAQNAAVREVKIWKIALCLLFHKRDNNGCPVGTKYEGL